MLRTFLLAALVLVALSPVVSRAQTVIPRNVNIHNGVIEVRNHIQVYGYNGLEGASTRLTVWNDWRTEMEDTYVNTGGSSIFLYHCCYAAGSVYFLRAYTHQSVTSSIPEISFRPQLCNVRGIPFGYAVIELTGTLTRSKSNYWVGETHARVLPAPCPERQEGY